MYFKFLIESHITTAKTKSLKKIVKTKIIVWIFYTTFQLQIDLEDLNYFAISK